jgi:molybdopterin biosynthesis enzyme
LLLAKAFLQTSLGSTEALPYFSRLPAVAGTDLKGAGFKENFVRVKLVSTPSGLVASSTGNQSSGVLTSMLLADALAIISPNTNYQAGDKLEVIRLKHYL